MEFDIDHPYDQVEDDDLRRAVSRELAAKARLGPRELKCAKATIQFYRKGRTKQQVAEFLHVNGGELNILLHENLLVLQERLGK